MELKYIKLEFHKSSFKESICVRNFFFFHMQAANNQMQPETQKNSKQPETKQTTETEKTKNSSPTHTIYIYIYISFEVSCIKKMHNATNPTSTMGRE